MCQLYPYFSLGKSRSHLWQGGRTLCWIVEVHTLAKTGHGRLDRNHRCRRNEMQIWGGGGEGGEAEDTSELHFKMLRVWKSTVPSILATISLSLFSSLSFFLSHFFQHLSIYLLRARTFFSRFYNINIDDETDYFAVSWKNIWKKSSDIDFFFFLIRPKNEREIYLICIFLRIIVKMFVFIISPYNEQLFIIRNNIRKKRAVISLSIFFFFYNHSVAASKFTTTSFFCMVNIVTLCPCREKYKD